MVVIGDSITDGVGWTDDRNRRWPDVLAERLQADPALASIAVVNSGIAGNRLLNDASAPFVGPSMLTRFERDVSSKPNVRWVVVLTAATTSARPTCSIAERPSIGAADHRWTAEADCARACEGYQGLRRHVVAEGGSREALRPHPGSPGQRNEVNASTRSAGAFDAVVDFDLLMRDPERPDHLAL